MLRGCRKTVANHNDDSTIYRVAPKRNDHEIRKKNCN